MGLISNPSFAWAAFRRVVIFTAASLLFVPVLMAFAAVAQPDLWPLGMIAVVVVKPAIYIVFVLSFVWILAPQARSTGFSVVLTFGILLLFAADFRFGLSLGFARDISFKGWLESWRIEFPYFLTGMAAISTLCVLRGGEAVDQSWSERLGHLSNHAIICVVLLFVAGIWGTLLEMGIFLPGVRILLFPFLAWPIPGRHIRVLAALGPLLLSPIALVEWCKAGEPGRHSQWFKAVAAATLVVCATSAAMAALFLSLVFHLGEAIEIDFSLVWNMLGFIAFCCAVSLPGLIAKMLDDPSPPSRNSSHSQAASTPGRNARPATFGRRGNSRI